MLRSVDNEKATEPFFLTYDAQTTRKGLEDIELVLKREGESRLTGEEESRLAGLGEVKVIHTGRTVCS